MTVTLGQDNLEDRIVEHVRHDYAALKAEQTVGESLASLRTVNLAEKIIYFYVVDDEGKLVGVVPTRRLLMSQPGSTIRQIMVDHVVSIPESMTVRETCESFVKHRFLAFPVVDGERRLRGIVDVSLFTDGIFDVTRKQSAQDVFQLIGVRLVQGQRVSAWAGFRSRFPWLLCNIGGGIVCALLSGMYEAFLDSVIVLALFIPVVLALAESVSIQSMTITLQSLHEDRIQWGRMFRRLRVEFLTACLLGAASGGVVALAALLWKRQGMVAEAIGASICFAIITASLLGIVLPTAVRAFRGDPKIAAGPIVLAMSDVATLLFYFNLAGWMLT